MTVLKLEFPTDAMITERGWGLERVWFEQGRLILGQRMERAKELKADVSGLWRVIVEESDDSRVYCGVLMGNQCGAAHTLEVVGFKFCFLS